MYNDTVLQRSDKNSEEEERKLGKYRKAKNNFECEGRRLTETRHDLQHDILRLHLFERGCLALSGDEGLAIEDADGVEILAGERADDGGRGKWRLQNGRRNEVVQ